MARDKRTRRAEARRRRREELRAETASASASAEPAEGAAATKRRSLLDVLGPLFVLPDVGADVRALPGIARHTLAFALPLAAIAVAFFVALDPSVSRLQSEPGASATVVLARSLYQFLLLPPPILAVFGAAALAPRAGWLVGAIVGLVSTSLFLLLFAIQGPTDPNVAPLTPAVALQTLVTFLPTYVLLGAFASWYRRFLLGMQSRTRQKAEERRKTQARAAKRARTAPARR